MILVINTSGGDLEFVLGDKYARIQSSKQSSQLPMACENFMRDCGARWSDLTAIAVVVGPGSFTGIRIGIAYAKGLSMGLKIPVVGINAFELYLGASPDACVAIDSGRGDFFVGAANLQPCTMTIDELEERQMAWPRTVGHKPFDLTLATRIAEQKLANGTCEPVIPMYLRPSYAEENKNKK